MKPGARILITGGGTGGHIYPGLAVAEALLNLAPDVEVRFAGTRNGLESVLVPRAGYSLHRIPASGLRGMGAVARLLFVINFMAGLVCSLLLMLRWRPNLALGTGGYVSGPVLTAARLLGVSCCVQEQNAVPGSANRLVGRWSQRIYLGTLGGQKFFPTGRCRLTGNPVREAFVAAASSASLETPTVSDSATDVPEGEPGSRVLIFGGSRGARTLNDAVSAAASHWHGAGPPSLWIQTGAGDLPRVRAAFGLAATEQPAHDRSALRVVPYIQDMATALGWADLVVCRAGAMTLAELQITGRAAILVPFPHATDQHQLRNAEVCARAGAAVVLKDDQCDGDTLIRLVSDLLGDAQRRSEMAAAARKLGRPTAATDIAGDLLFQAGHRAGRRFEPETEDG